MQVYFTDRCAAIVHGKFYPAKTNEGGGEGIVCVSEMIQRGRKNRNYTEKSERYTGGWIFSLSYRNSESSSC